MSDARGEPEITSSNQVTNPAKSQAGRMLGQQHNEILQSLLDRVALLESGDTSACRIVVLEGASGVGKSRIIREFYERLRQDRQPLNKRYTSDFWPPLIGGSGDRHGESDPMPNRKVLGPDLSSFVWKSNALPTFTWWTLDCGQMANGAMIDVIAQARASVAVNSLPARIAWLAAASPLEKVKASEEQIVDWLRGEIQSYGQDSFFKVLEQSSKFFPALPTLISAGHLLWKTGQQLWDRHQQTKATVILSTTDSARIEANELASSILDVAHRKLPAIVVVEDIHLMGAGLAELAEQLSIANSRRPVLIIGTAWRETSGNQGYENWRAQNRQIDFHRVGNLDEDSLLELLDEVAPQTEVALKKKVAHAFPNPLALKLFLSDGEVTWLIAGTGPGMGVHGELRVNEEYLTKLSRDLRVLYERRWRALDLRTQNALKWAAATLPGTAPITWMFNREIVARAAAKAGFLQISPTMSEDDVLTEIARSRQDYGWLEASQESQLLDAFREAPLAQIALDSMGDLQRGALLDATLPELRAWIHERRQGRYFLDMSDEEGLHAAQWIGFLRGDDDPTIEDAVAAIAVARSAQAWRDGRRALQDFSSALLGLLDPNHRDTLNLRAEIAEARARDSSSFRREDAELAAVQMCQAQLFGEQDPDAVQTLSTLAMNTYLLHDWDNAVDAYAELLRITTQYEYPQRDIMSAFGWYVSALSMRGDHKEAIDAANQYVIAASKLGDLECAKANAELASCLRSAGDYAGAVERLDEVAAVYSERLSEGSKEWLSTIQLRISVLMDDARLVDAGVDLERLQRQLAADPATPVGTVRKVQRLRAILLMKLEEFEPALEIFEAQRQVIIDAGGGESISVASAEEDLAECLMAAERFTDAAESYQRLWNVYESELGSFDVSTMQAAIDCATALLRAGACPKALTIASGVIDTIEPDSRQRVAIYVTARIVRAKTFTQLDRPGDAVAECAAVLDFCVLQYGQTDPITRDARGGLIDGLIAVEKYADASDLCLFGLDLSGGELPLIGWSRELLRCAQLSMLIGQDDDALNYCDQVVEAFTRAAESDETAVGTGLNALAWFRRAEALSALRRKAEAITSYEHAASSYLQSFGTEHAWFLLTQERLAPLLHSPRGEDWPLLAEVYENLLEIYLRLDSLLVTNRVRRVRDALYKLLFQKGELKQSIDRLSMRIQTEPDPEHAISSLRTLIALEVEHRQAALVRRLRAQAAEDRLVAAIWENGVEEDEDEGANPDEGEDGNADSQVAFDDQLGAGPGWER